MHIFKNPFLAGAIAESGNELSELITDLAELSTAHAIVEFGPGTGVFTRVAQRKAPPNTPYIAIERDHAFIAPLHKEFPHIAIFEDSAASIAQHLHENGLTDCDRIISGLPWTIFSKQMQEETLNAAYHALCIGGIFVTFAYIQSRYIPAGIRFKHMLEHTFDSVHVSHIIWRNTPPAFVYVCRK